MTWKPDLTVAALVERAGRFLVVEERISGRLVINQPAGHVEDGESFLDAVVRETREETAWGFTPQFFLGSYLWRCPRTARSFLRLAFGGTVHDHDAAQALDRGIVAAHWLTADELRADAQRLRSPLVMRCIDDYLAGHRFDLGAVIHLEDEQPQAVRALAQRVSGG